MPTVRPVLPVVLDGLTLDLLITVWYGVLDGSKFASDQFVDDAAKLSNVQVESNLSLLTVRLVETWLRLHSGNSTRQTLESPRIVNLTST